SAPVGTEILASGKPAGTLFTQAGGKAIAFLRFQRAALDMDAGSATINWSEVG
ncbi:MAG: folate-binding protein, partial [Pseudomonadota bacterium]